MTDNKINSHLIQASDWMMTKSFDFTFFLVLDPVAIGCLFSNWSALFSGKVLKGFDSNLLSIKIDKIEGFNWSRLMLGDQSHLFTNQGKLRRCIEVKYIGFGLQRIICAKKILKFKPSFDRNSPVTINHEKLIFLKILWKNLENRPMSKIRRSWFMLPSLQPTKMKVEIGHFD